MTSGGFMLWDKSNPYQLSVDNLERALDYCRQGAHDACEVPHMKGVERLPTRPLMPPG